jgi:circadian clock protein KaiC
MEMHLAVLHRMVREFDPRSVIIDPISNFASAGTSIGAESLLLRLIDFLKTSGITAMLINLTSGGRSQEATEVGVSSLIDTWLVVRDMELGGERNRGLYVIKSRGMKHSNQIREFLITSDGIQLEDVYVGPEGVLAGSMRLAQEARERSAAIEQRQQLERKQRELERRRATLESQILALRHEFSSVEEEARIIAEQSAAQDRASEQERAAAGVRRGADQTGE